MAFSGLQVTQHGIYGSIQIPYESFSGKSAGTPSTGVSDLTQDLVLNLVMDLVQ